MDEVQNVKSLNLYQFWIHCLWASRWSLKKLLGITGEIHPDRTPDLNGALSMVCPFRSTWFHIPGRDGRDGDVARREALSGPAARSAEPEPPWAPCHTLVHARWWAKGKRRTRARIRIVTDRPVVRFAPFPRSGHGRRYSVEGAEKAGDCGEAEAGEPSSGGCVRHRSSTPLPRSAWNPKPT